MLPSFLVSLRILKKNRDFVSVSKHGKVAFSRSLLLQYIPVSQLQNFNHEHNDVFCGITVSRKVGNAVVRNRMKRVLRVVLRNTVNLLHPGLCYVIICRRGAYNKHIIELQKEFVSCADKARRCAARAFFKEGPIPLGSEDGIA